MRHALVLRKSLKESLRSPQSSPRNEAPATKARAQEVAVDIPDTSQERTPIQADFPPIKERPKSEDEAPKASMLKKFELPVTEFPDVPKRARQHVGHLKDIAEVRSPAREQTNTK